MIQYGICAIFKHIEAKFMEKDYNDILKIILFTFNI